MLLWHVILNFQHCEVPA